MGTPPARGMMPSWVWAGWKRKALLVTSLSLRAKVITGPVKRNEAAKETNRTSNSFGILGYKKNYFNENKRKADGQENVREIEYRFDELVSRKEFFVEILV